MGTVDLNCDLGEGMTGPGGDEALLEVVTSANIACGYHAGDPATMREVARAAHARGVAIGAHVSYQDRPGFGRTILDVSPAVLRGHVKDQLEMLHTLAAEVGARVTYVKPHGGLYNAIVTDEAQAAAVVAAVAAHDRTLVLLGLPGSVVLDLAARSGLRTATEAFADRAYTAQGHLVPRSEPGAVLHDPALIARRCVAMATGAPITDVHGDPLLVRPDSICVHGDTPGSLAIARAVRAALAEAGVTLAPFAGPAPAA